MALIFLALVLSLSAAASATPTGEIRKFLMLPDETRLENFAGRPSSTCAGALRLTTKTGNDDASGTDSHGINFRIEYELNNGLSHQGPTDFIFGSDLDNPNVNDLERNAVDSFLIPYACKDLTNCRQIKTVWFRNTESDGWNPVSLKIELRGTCVKHFDCNFWVENDEVDGRDWHACSNGRDTIPGEWSN